MDKQKQKVVATGVFAALIVSNIGGFAWHTYSMNKLEEESAKQIETLQEIVDTVGEVKVVYTLNTDVKAGQIIKEDHLIEKELPSSMFSDEYVVNAADLNRAFYKVDAKAGTPLTQSIVTDEIVSEDSRLVDIILDSYPVGAKEGDYVDIRLTTPLGQDYIVLSKVRLYSNPVDTTKVLLNEEQQHMYQSALVDAFLNKGSNLYATTYVEAAYQNAAEVYYPVSKEVLTAMEIDPNIEAIAEKNMLLKRREIFENSNVVSQQQTEAISSKRQELTQKMLKDQELYRKTVLQEVADEITEEEEAPSEEASEE